MYSLLYRVSETCKLFGLFSDLNVSLTHTHLSPHSNLPPQLRALAAILCSRYLYLYMRTEIWGIKDKHFPVRCPPGYCLNSERLMVPGSVYMTASDKTHFRFTSSPGHHLSPFYMSCFNRLKPSCFFTYRQV